MNMTRFRAFFFVLASCVGALAAPAHATTYVVTSTADNGAGTLREAMTNAEASSNQGGADRINFSIRGAGVHTITLDSPLPTVFEAVVIDGYSQPGSVANTSSSADNATLQMEIKGNGRSFFTPFNIYAPNCTFKGLTINSLSSGFSILSAAAQGNHIEGCFIGTDVTGTKAFPNALGGIGIFNGANNNVIGGTSPAARNLISGNAYRGIDITINGDNAPHDNFVQGNFIGVDASGTKALGNQQGGIYLQNTTKNTIGGTAAGAGNVIAGNGQNGLRIDGSQSTGNILAGNFIGTNASGAALGNTAGGIVFFGGPHDNSVTGNAIAFNANAGIAVNDAESVGNDLGGNSIYENGGLGIKLIDSRDVYESQSIPRSNDVLDADSGPNNGQNWPIITSIGGGKVSGTLDSLPNSTFSVDIYGNDVSDASGFGGGRYFLGRVPGVETDAKGHAQWSFALPTGAGGDGQSFSTTATSASGDTSEFGPAGALGVVVNTRDSGGGSLRNALTVARFVPGTTVVFNIPKTDPNFANGVFTITPTTTDLPSITTDGTIIDGATQKLFTPDANVVGPAIVLNGAAIPESSYAPGLRFYASHCALRNLVINGFIRASAVQIYGGDSSGALVATDNRIQSCYIGTDATGTQAIRNANGIEILNNDSASGSAATATLIGGNSDATRNVIAGNGNYGILFKGSAVSGNTVSGNYVGVDRTGSKALPNGDTAIGAGEGAHDNIVGGTAPGMSNVLVGINAGVRLLGVGTRKNSILGNLIGTDALATQVLGAGAGISIDDSAQNNLIGGTQSGAGNIISSSGTAISLGNTSGNTVQGNLVGVNRSGAALANGVGIELNTAHDNLIGGTQNGAGNTICAGTSAGIRLVDVQTKNNTIQGNLIGIAPDGQTPLANTVGVLFGYGANNNLLGGTAAGAGNVISGNTEIGVAFQSAATKNSVQGNFIGTNAANLALGNGREGVLIELGATSNLIGAAQNAAGSTVSAAANRIENNGGDGVAVVYDNSVGNTVRGNAISKNSGLGINLRLSDGSGTGVNGNDASDDDSGPNDLQNFPLIGKISVLGGKTTVSGTLNSAPDTSFAIDLYDNSVAEPSGFGEGTTYLDTQSVKTDAKGNAPFSFVLNGATYSGLFSVTATNSATGDTSEFSPQGASAVVTNTLDSGPGSLRNALNIANTLLGSTVNFNIPTTDAGFKNGVFTISPLSALPIIQAQGTIVDGASQTAFGGNTNSKGPEIAIDGGKMREKPDGLVVQTSNCTIRGLSLTRFLTGILLSQEPATGNTIQGCYLGIGADGTSAAGNVTGISCYYGAKNNLIGGDTSGEGNIISGNSGDGIALTDTKTTGNRIQGNFIGTNAPGTAPVPNGSDGVSIAGAVSNFIGGNAAKYRNLISGNGRSGISSNSGAGNQIQGNFIGTDASGATAIANTSNGLTLYGGTATIGGAGAGEGNRIAFNRFYGLDVQDSGDQPNTHITIRGNQIYSNGFLGIDLLSGTNEQGYGGVTNNDEAEKDADTGPNGLQNYPVITGFAARGAQTVISGTLTSAPDRDYDLDFYRVTRPDSSGYGEGDAYLGQTRIHTDPNGLASFDLEGTFSGQYFSATATDVLSGDTSEFSSASVSVAITGFSPQIGPVGTVVTLRGGSFIGTTAVEFGDAKANYTIGSNGTTLTATVPRGTKTGPIRVTTPVGVAQTETEFIVTPPFNDDLAAALTIEHFGGGLSGYNKGATEESGEPNHGAPGGSSVWYKWQPAFTGRASVGTKDADFDTTIAVYTGTKISDLQLVASNNDAGSSRTSALTFAATQDKTYYIALDGVGAAQGHFTLNWTIVNKAPANDDFAKAQLLESNSIRANGTNLLATKEAGEPDHAAKLGNTSVWYSWTPSESGLASFSTEGSTIDTLLAVYTGDSVSALRPVASNDDSGGNSSSRVDFSAIAGTTYKIAVDGFNGAQGDLQLTGSLNANRSTLTWTGAARDGLWSSAANWMPQRVPLPTDTVSIEKGGTYTVTLDIDSNIDGLILGRASSNSVRPTLLLPTSHVLTFNSGVVNTLSTLSLAGGTFHDNYGLELRGLFSWTSGTWSGYHTYISSRGVLDISGRATKELDYEGITNLGVIKWRDSGDIAGDNGASILNQKTFEISGDAALSWDGTGKQPSFLNDRGAAFFKRKITTGVTTVGWLYGNDGAVKIEAGALNLQGGGVSYGDFDIALDARVNVAADYVFDKQTSRFTGAGFAAIISGNTGFDIGVTATNFELSQGSLEGSSDLSVSQKFIWSGGAMNEIGTTTNSKGGVMEIGGTSAKAIAQRTLVNNGIVNWSGGAIQADNGAKISNNGLFNCVVGTKLVYRSGQKLEWNNAKGANLTGSTTIGGNFSNFGHIKPLKTLRLGAPGARSTSDFNEGGGLINITGDMLQGAGAQIDIVVNGTLDPQTHQPLYGQLVIGGDVELNGNCGLTITTPNYVPKKGDQFKIMRALSIAGDFTTISYPALPANLFWSSAKVPESGTMSYVLKVTEKAPILASFSPPSGVAGTILTLKGVNLSNSDGTLPLVSFGGLKVPALSSTPTQIKVAIPSSVKTGKIAVITTGGAIESAAPLLIQPLITSVGPVMGATGQTITLKGTNFVTPATPKPIIKFNQTFALGSDLVSISANQVKVKVPIGATSGEISLKTSDGIAFSPLSLTFLAPPIITSAPGGAAVGATITVKGKNFVNALTPTPKVKFGTFTVPSANLTQISATQLKIMVPAGAKNGKISIENSGGVAQSAGDFVLN